MLSLYPSIVLIGLVAINGVILQSSPSPSAPSAVSTTQSGVTTSSGQSAAGSSAAPSGVSTTPSGVSASAGQSTAKNSVAPSGVSTTAAQSATSAASQPSGVSATTGASAGSASTGQSGGSPASQPSGGNTTGASAAGSSPAQPAVPTAGVTSSPAPVDISAQISTNFSGIGSVASFGSQQECDRLKTSHPSLDCAGTGIVTSFGKVLVFGPMKGSQFGFKGYTATGQTLAPISDKKDMPWGLPTESPVNVTGAPLSAHHVCNSAVYHPVNQVVFFSVFDPNGNPEKHKLYSVLHNGSIDSMDTPNNYSALIYQNNNLFGLKSGSDWVVLTIAGHKVTESQTYNWIDFLNCNKKSPLYDPSAPTAGTPASVTTGTGGDTGNTNSTAKSSPTKKSNKSPFLLILIVVIVIVVIVAIVCVIYCCLGSKKTAPKSADTKASAKATSAKTGPKSKSKSKSEKKSGETLRSA
ncbi:unnamed protein product [Medioppia subpectinata]|uniref:Uncharacterized protein n=1 Tax=Medioppia subpectinata TaxID=1979941 RepID=A0A7R9PZK1_9ACAR|nr:unnamed protein product [Medioppia subpectinata]CAG2106545.1 unnamed protein product [Medioppia subpectinata]